MCKSSKIDKQSVDEGLAGLDGAMDFAASFIAFKSSQPSGESAASVPPVVVTKKPAEPETQPVVQGNYQMFLPSCLLN